jgi:biopolymer transport protein ExbB
MSDMIIDIYSFLAKGGFLMIPIMACSVAALAFFLERLWNLQRRYVLPERFRDVVFERIREDKYSEAKSLCQTNDSPLAAMLKAGIEKAGSTREEIKEVILEAGEAAVYRLERFVNALGAIATVTPLLGLLGTVVGMIQVFQGVVGQAAGGGAVNAAALANGIWEALISTAAGLAVAIPTYLAYRYILNRIDTYAVQLEETCLEIADELSGSSIRETTSQD